LEWQTLKELEKIQQAQAQNPKGFEQIRKSAEEMSRLFKDWPISESRDWDFVSDQSPFPLRAMMDFHFRILQQRGSQPGAQNFDWWVRSDRRIRSMQQNMGSLNGSDSDGATRLNILHTNLLTAMKPTVKERLKKALGTYRSNRSGQDGLGPVMDLLKLCTVGAGALHFASAEDARKVRSEGGTWASNTVLVDRDYSESCRELSCVLPERFSASVEVINPSTRAEADAVAANRRYVCALAKSYPDSLARLSREFKDHGTVCGQPFASALAPANSRPGHR
jgi:hypothetical protein